MPLLLLHMLIQQQRLVVRLLLLLLPTICTPVSTLHPVNYCRVRLTLHADETLLLLCDDTTYMPVVDKKPGERLRLQRKEAVGLIQNPLLRAVRVDTTGGRVFY